MGRLLERCWYRNGPLSLLLAPLSWLYRLLVFLRRALYAGGVITSYSIHYTKLYDAFNIVSTLVMTVTDKTSDIAILRTLGATPRRILLIFMVQGSLIGAVGTLIGVVGGVALALNVETLVPAIEHLFGIQFLSADVYYISELPSDLHWSDVFHISWAALAMGVITSYSIHYTKLYEAPTTARWMCASSPPPTATWKKRWRPAAFAPTSTTA